jgi:hypothetical protein
VLCESSDMQLPLAPVEAMAAVHDDVALEVVVDSTCREQAKWLL